MLTSFSILDIILPIDFTYTAFPTPILLSCSCDNICIVIILLPLNFGLFKNYNVEKGGVEEVCICV